MIIVMWICVHPLQGDSLWKSEKHSPLHCIYGFAYGFR